MFSLRTVFPLLLMMAAGLAARRLGIIGQVGARQANNCVFRIFLPLLLCFDVMDTQLGASVDFRTLGYGAVAVLLCFGLMFLLAPRLAPQRNMRGVLIQGVSRSNYAIFGIPLVLNMYPDADTSIAVLMVLVAVPLFNVISTIALMVYGSEKPSAGKIIKGVLLNPLILGTLAGFLLWKLQVQLPALLDAPLRSLGGLASPLALFLLGASLDFRKVRANARLLAIGVCGRLLIVPLVFLSIGVLLGIRDVALATLIALFASPTAVGSYPMAQQMGGDEDLAAGQVVLTTAFSSFTVFFWVFILKALSFLG